MFQWCRRGWQWLSDYRRRLLALGRRTCFQALTLLRQKPFARVNQPIIRCCRTGTCLAATGGRVDPRVMLGQLHNM
jgi:hypothetical protein